VGGEDTAKHPPDNASPDIANPDIASPANSDAWRPVGRRDHGREPTGANATDGEADLLTTDVSLHRASYADLTHRGGVAAPRSCVSSDGSVDLRRHREAVDAGYGPQHHRRGGGRSQHRRPGWPLSAGRRFPGPPGHRCRPGPRAGGLDARRFSLDLRRVEVGDVVADTTEGFRPVSDQARLEMAIQVSEAPDLWASADPDRLAQVLANLIENALEFADQRSSQASSSRTLAARARSLASSSRTLASASPPPPRGAGV